MRKVVVYRTPICPYCVRAVQLLKQKGVDFEEIDVSNDPAKRDWLIEETGQRTVPQIFVDGRPIGGCDDLVRLNRDGQLGRLLGNG